MDEIRYCGDCRYFKITDRFKPGRYGRYGCCSNHFSVRAVMYEYEGKSCEHYDNWPVEPKRRKKAVSNKKTAQQEFVF
jgi:hypothetical protein